MPGRYEAVEEVIKRISSLTKEERTLILDWPDHLRRMVLHLGTLSKLVDLLKKSYQQQQWVQKRKITVLVEQLLTELDQKKGIISPLVYIGSRYVELQRLEGEELAQEEKLTFRSYDWLQALLHQKHQPRTEAKLKTVQQRLQQALRWEKQVESLDVQINTLLTTGRTLINILREKIVAEQRVLQELQNLLSELFIATDLTSLKKCHDQLQEEIRYGRKLMVRLNEEFYKPFKKFIDEKYGVEDLVYSTLTGKMRWYHLGLKKPQLTREDFVLDYYTLTSPDDVIEYIAVLDSLPPGCIHPGLRKFLNRNRKRLVQRVKAQKASLTQQILTLGKDSLTGVATKGTLLAKLLEFLDFAGRKQLPLSLLMMDIDHFKSINDNYGHPTGDAVLRSVAQTIARTVRRYDFVARYGGEEFTVLLPNTSKAEALIVAEKIRRNVSERNKEPINPLTQGPITISIGLATYPDDYSVRKANLLAGQGFLEKVGLQLIQAADQALYAAKRAGRNRAVAA